MDFNEAIGAVILDYIKAKGIKSSAIARYLNDNGVVKCDSAKLSITLHGKRTLTLLEYKLICDFVGVPYDKFLGSVKEAE